jgi:hypothetical protein
VAGATAIASTWPFRSLASIPSSVPPALLFISVAVASSDPAYAVPSKS